jgi:nucleotide-binding universal stress UspA family protein
MARAPSRIVVGAELADGELGRGSQLAVEQARWMAHRTGAHITLLHSSQLDERWDPDAAGYAELRGAGTAAERAPLDTAAGRLRSDGIEVEVATTDGPAAIELIRRALREPADIVIVGKRGHAQTDGRRLGSVSQSVVRYCPCPVMVVKPGSAPTPKIVVAATDASDVGARVVDAAASIAERCGAALHVIHAIQLSFGAQMKGAETEFVSERRQDLTKAVGAQVAAAGFGGELQIHAGVTCPTRAVHECEERLRPDLIVMGTVSRTGLAGLVLGNTAERLLGTLDCSLLVVKPEGFTCPLDL